MTLYCARKVQVKLQERMFVSEKMVGHIIKYIQPNILIKFILNRTEGLSVANWG